jgi:hypothetical protein
LCFGTSEELKLEFGVLVEKAENENLKEILKNDQKFFEKRKNIED